jgi:hypothetical protein
MTISISTNRFTSDDLGLLFNAFGHTVCWMRGVRGQDSGELIIDRPNGGSWHWKRGLGRWTVRKGGDILDGWV